MAVALHVMVRNIHNSCHTTLKHKVNSMYSNLNVFNILKFRRVDDDRSSMYHEDARSFVLGKIVLFIVLNLVG